MQYYSNDYKIAIKLLFNKDIDNRGENTMVNCPFHEDKTPSLSIHNTTGQYRCFSAKCKRSGHISSLCYEILHKPLYSILGKTKDDEFLNFVDSPKSNPLRVIRNEEKEVKKIPTIEEVESDIRMDIRGFMVPWYQSDKAVSYIRRRFISSEIADLHKMSYMESGYINGYLYEERLCIPIYGRDDKLLAVEGRDVTERNKRKCIYPYRSIKPVYGFNSLDLTKPVKLFEGLIKKAVAQSDPYFKENSTNVFGSQLSKYQLQYLNLIPHIILCPDNDEAGEEMVKDMKEKYKGTLDIMRINVRGVKDHDEIPKKLGVSVEEFRKHGGFTTEHYKRL